MTLDYFHIAVKDRIAQSSSQTLSAQEAADLESAGITGARDLSVFRYYTNGFSTTTRGVDLIVGYPIWVLGGSNLISLTANWTKTAVDEVKDSIFDEKRIRQLEEGLPEYRLSLASQHRDGPWRTSLRLNYFDGFYEAHMDDGSFPIEAGAEFTVDAEVSYAMSNLTVAIGATNLFNEYPDENEYRSISGSKYPETSPLGFNGGFYYSRLTYQM